MMSKRISEEINELKKAKIRIVQGEKQDEMYEQRIIEADSTLKTVSTKVN